MSGILIESVWAPMDLELLLGSSYLEALTWRLLFRDFAAISLTERLLNAVRSNGSGRRLQKATGVNFSLII